MENTSSFSTFTDLYSLSKTLRFQLIPQGKTLEHIEKNGILNHDDKRAKDYKTVKILVDNYHKFFIETALSALPPQDWQPLEAAIQNNNHLRTPETQKKLEEQQTEMRKKIAKHFKNQEIFNDLFGAKLFKELLPAYMKTSELSNDLYKDAVDTFKKFSTYFTGFHETRKNIYKSEPIATAIPHRLVHENFPKFLSNITAYETLRQHFPTLLEQASQSLTQHLLGRPLGDFFTLGAFNQCLTQSGIEQFNTLIGGISRETETEKLKGINEHINLWIQQHPDQRQTLTKCRMVPLYKQILSDRSSYSFILEAFQDDQSLLDALKSFLSTFTNTLENITRFFSEDLSAYPPETLFIPSGDLSKVSQSLLGSWNGLSELLRQYAEKETGNGRALGSKAKVEKWMKRSEFSFRVIADALGKDPDSLIALFSRNITEKIKQVRTQRELLHPLISKTTPHLRENPAQTEILKTFLDACQALLHEAQTLSADETWKDLTGQLAPIIPLYNKVRNYITQKPFETGKYKLNFENPTLANGWDQNQEQANTALLFLRNGNYYLGIMNAKSKPELETAQATPGEPIYKKMVYKLLPGPNKMLPKVFFSEKGQVEFSPPDFILEGYKAEKHKKGDQFDLNFCHELINFFKDAINQHQDWKKFNFQFSPTETYQDISQFYKEISHQGYKMTFEDLSAQQIEKWVEEGKLFLFQIYNKDFAPGATGRPNLHTLYWKALFDQENLTDVAIKLNGEAELFYRPGSIAKPFIHAPGERMVNRRDRHGHPIPEKIHKELVDFENGKLSELTPAAQAIHRHAIIKPVTHAIIKDRRYTRPTFLFHTPITLNFKAEGVSKFNDCILEKLKTTENEICIIGLDRGERHLIYLTLINSKGEILLQKSFNTINGFDYQEKLKQRETERDEARKSWNSIGQIKELKEGYLSQVIHEITTLMVRHNAIIALEDLNFGFKRGRFHVERQVYQKFEKMLIDKLNYLTFKELPPRTPGGILCGLQLTEAFESFKKLGKQSGLLFYVPAAYTSKIDPTTGFANLLSIPAKPTEEDAAKIIRQIETIRYNPKENYFEFHLNYAHGTHIITKDRWIACTAGDLRYAYDPEKKGTRPVDVTSELKSFLTQEAISFKSGNDLKTILLNNAKCCKKILYYLRLALQLRHSNATTGDDFILSPVKNKTGTFFDSRTAPPTFPQNADANGAYHIALKGLYLLQEKIRKDEKLEVKHPDWFRYVKTRNQ